MSVRVTFACPVCGREVTVTRKREQKTYFCGLECYNFARNNGMWKQTLNQSEPGDLVHHDVKIKITREVPLFPEMRPKVGEIYAAERYEGRFPSYVIAVNGRRINIRYNECMEVKE